MSFLKGIFGKDDKKPAGTPPAAAKPGMSAPPARPFPAGFAPDPSPPPTHHQHSHSQQMHAQQFQPQQAAPPSQQNGGGDMFDLFDGLSLKQPTPTHAEPPHANGHTDALPPANTAATGPADDDMFSGLTVAAADTVPSVDAPPSSGGSLLNMLNSDGDHADEPSGFSFVAETSGGGEGEGEATVNGAEEAQSSFSFMASAPVEPEPVVQATPTPTAESVRKQSVTERKPSMSEQVSPVSRTSSAPRHTEPTNQPSSTRSSFSSPAPALAAATTPGGSRKSVNAGGTAAPTFEQIHRQIDSSLTEYWDDLKGLSLKQSSMRTQQIVLQTSLKAIQNEIQQLEQQQQSEIDQENYEVADSINEQLDQLKARLSSLHNDLASSTRALEEQERNKHHLRMIIREFLEDALKQYGLLTKQYTFQMMNSITAETQLLEQKEDILITNLEKTRRNLAHTLSDITNIEKEEATIREKMSIDTQEMTKEYDVLKSQLNTLEAERDELRALLQAKEEQCAMCTQKIDVVVTSIEGKKSSHQKKLSRAAEKKHRLQTEQSQAESEESSLLKAKAELEQDFHRVAAQEKGSTRKLKKMQEEVAYVQAVVTHKLTVPSEKEEKSEDDSGEAAAAASPAAQPDLATLQQRLQLTLTQLDETRTKLASLESQIEVHAKQLDSVGARIPALEAEKNLAVATRDFKKAASASKDVKTLQTQKSELEAAIAALRDEGSQLNSALTNLTEAKSSLQAKLVEVQGEADKKLLRGFLKSKLELARKKQELQSVMDKNQAELTEAENANGTGTPLSPASAAVAANNLATSTAHHFGFLAHELSAYSIEEELLSKEISSLRLANGWSESYGEDDARAELLAERRSRGEVTDEDTKQKEDQEESTISEQRRKDRNAAIAAAAAAAAAEESGASTEQPGPAAAEPTSATATSIPSSPTTTTTNIPAELSEPGPAAPTDDAQPSPAGREDERAPAAEPEPAHAEPDIPVLPAGPSEEQIQNWRGTYAAAGEAITNLEGQLQSAIETEEFEEADRLETELTTKRTERTAVEMEAKNAGIDLTTE